MEEQISLRTNHVKEKENRKDSTREIKPIK